ncbi:hypothetical protein CI109_101511 [Kwoniella shandongensis]|uniref:Uncharacterized protein n=1 Tax=Kwoniella shandongensis TaxID=1734106 RepID=A0A5M6C6A0_9TREE|nr:uncharacterized protein CI109_001357 [Kwoniella shandongensis]KAA5530553.1 hypothetical protein CI109_001357 [Kwoniella shandongensis]
MKQLDTELLELIFRNLSIRDILACSLVSKQFRQIIIDSPHLQLELTRHLYRVSPIDEERISSDFTLGVNERLRRLVKYEMNIERLRPKISILEPALPEHHEICVISEDYIITHPSNLPDQGQGTPPEMYTLCVIRDRRDGTVKEIKIPFEPREFSITVNVEEDVVVVVDWEESIHVFHLFNEGEDAVAYLDFAIDLGDEEDWDIDEEPNVRFLSGQRFIVWANGVHLIYRWTDGTCLARLPPRGLGTWGDGEVMTRYDLMLGLRNEMIPGDDRRPNGATLAIFDLNRSNHFDPYTDPVALLELPFSTQTLPSVVRSLLNLPADPVIDFIQGLDFPFIHQADNPDFLVLSLTFSLGSDGDRNNIVIAIEIAQLLSLADLNQPISSSGRQRTWANESTPFPNIEKIPFVAWKDKAYLWIEDHAHPLNPGCREAQHGRRLLSFDHDLLAQQGKLRLTLRDFEQRVLKRDHCRPGLLAGLGTVRDAVSQGQDSGHAQPDRYQMDVRWPDHDVVGVKTITGEFALEPLFVYECRFDGKEFILHRPTPSKTWIADFSAGFEDFFV